MQRRSQDGLILHLPTGVMIALYIALTLAIVLAVGVCFALIAVRLVARATAGTSEFMMQHDVTWLFQRIWIIGLDWGTNWPVVLLYILAFAAYRAVLFLVRPKGDATEINLLLRVFGQRKSQTRLTRGLLLDWRQDGPVLLMSRFRSFLRGTIPVLTWGRLRGGISVALPLSIPEVAEKSTILAATYAVVIFTLIIQGLSLRAVIQRVLK